MKDFLDEIPARLAGGSPGAAVRAAASRGIAVLITIVLTIFLMSHGPRLLRGLLRQLPEDRRPVVSAALFHGYHRAWGYLVAILGKAVLVGFAVWFLSDLLHLPAPSVLGVVAAAASLVPRFGLALGAGRSCCCPPGSAALGGRCGRSSPSSAAAGRRARDGPAHRARTVRVGPAVSLGVVLLATNLYGIGGAAVVLAAVTVAMAGSNSSCRSCRRSPTTCRHAAFPTASHRRARRRASPVAEPS